MLVRVDGTLPRGVTAKDLVAVDHRPDRHRGRHGLRGRVRRRGGARAFDGKPDDDVQHGDRGGRARRHGRRRRHDDRLPEGPSVRAGRRTSGSARSSAGGRSPCDPGAKFDTTHVFDAPTMRPQVTWGTSPEMVVSIEDRVPDPDRERNAERREGIERALEYMGLDAQHRRSPTSASTRCSSARARTRGSRTCAKPRRRPRPPRRGQREARDGGSGSGLVKAQAEAEGLDRIFRDAGFEWREPGCSMCLAMNDDRLEPGERCASTSNRNFEGRQGAGGRTHLVSPAMAAAAAIAGHFVDVRRLY